MCPIVRAPTKSAALTGIYYVSGVLHILVTPLLHRGQRVRKRTKVADLTQDPHSAGTLASAPGAVVASSWDVAGPVRARASDPLPRAVPRLLRHREQRATAT